MAMFGDDKLQSQYNTIHSQLQNSGAYTPLTMPEQDLDSITEQLAQIYRPQVERAIAQRIGATKQQKAAIDVDAASRGMGTSTFVTDAKNRIMNAEAADIAGLESDYASQLAGNALTQYQNYLSDKLKLDQYNQQLAASMEGAAYDQAMQQYQLGMLEGTLPYQQQQMQLEYQQKMLPLEQQQAQLQLEQLQKMSPLELQQAQYQLELQQMQLDQAKKAASGSGGTGGRQQYYLGKDGIWYSTQEEAHKSFDIGENASTSTTNKSVFKTGVSQLKDLLKTGGK